MIWLFNRFVANGINPYYFSIIMYAGINIILAVSLNLVNGFTGQFSMGHAGFMAIGAYSSAFFTTQMLAHQPGWMESPLSSFSLFLAAILLGGATAGIAGVIVGLPSLRLKGDYLAIVTLGFGEIIRVVLLNIDAVGGARGMAGIPALTNFAWVYGFVLITLFTITRLIQSRHGRAFLAVREDEIAAEAMGVNTTRAKVRAFVIGAVFAGIAGALFAHQLMYLNPQTFDFNRSFEIIIMVVLGGMGSITGSVAAAVFLTGTREALRPLQEFTKVDFRMVIYSLMLILLMLTRPNGLFGSQEISSILKLKRKKEGARG
ncbi:MAG: branched-chain amino acid ABC transporter permease [Oligoflexia bacterium]|nr:branched-chain amino acid ABC transporter permease [Oligoflexia bacterium]